MQQRKRIISVLIFYFAAAILVWVLTQFSPHAADGGWSLNAIAIIVLLFVVALLALINFYKGFKIEKTFFILGLLHLLVLLIGIYFLLL